MPENRFPVIFRQPHIEKQQIQCRCVPVDVDHGQECNRLSPVPNHPQRAVNSVFLQRFADQLGVTFVILGK